MRCSRSILAFLFLTLTLALPAAATEGPFVGLDFGWAEPANPNFRGHVESGVTANPYVGYMFNRYLGMQAQIHATYFNPDTHNRGFKNPAQATTVLGGTAGPRLSVPLIGPLELYGTAQAGGFTGLSGRLSHTAPGFSVGPGLELNISPRLAITGFGRWNYVFQSPRPKDLKDEQVQDQRGANDARWFTVGFGIKISFPEEEKPPAPPPPPPPPPAPEVVKRRIILRAVYFDFDKSNIRPDAAPVLDEAVEILKTDNLSVTAEGHCDGIGTVAYNQKLSERRAASVKKYMVDHGIPDNHIETIGYGKLRPVETNDTEEGRAKNRRVELNVK